VGPRACLDDMEKRKFVTVPGMEPQHLGPPARSQTALSRLKSLVLRRILRPSVSYREHRAKWNIWTQERIIAAGEKSTL
jgi:hypothetical protein